MVVRFTGGPQSAHTVQAELGGRWVSHVFSSFGSGTLLGVPTLYRATSLVDPVCLRNEWNHLSAKGVATPMVDVSRASIITPYDVEANRQDAKSRSDGTCGKGVYMACNRSRLGFRFTIGDDPERILNEVASYYRTERYAPYDEMFIESFEFLKNRCVRMEEGGFDDLVFESTQGLLLDAERGLLPHVTATPTGLDLLSEEELRSADVYLVARTYLTRHGNGYEPRQVRGFDFSDDWVETNVFNEFQGGFKTGGFDFDLLGEAFDRHNLSAYVGCRYHLAVTHLDIALRNGGMPYWKNGVLHHLPVSSESDYGAVFRLFRGEVAVNLEAVVGSSSPRGEFFSLP